MNDPVAWTIAGSDSGGGAGIQVDLKVMNALGVHGCCIITALTAQNTKKVEYIEPVSEKMFVAQWDALHEDLLPKAIKTGMLAGATICKQLAEKLDPSIPVVCDPVWRSSSGQTLLDPEAFDHLLYGVLPNVKILTPNLPEVEWLLGQAISSTEDAAEKILELGVHSVLIKGGHRSGNMCTDYWTDGTDSFYFVSPRIQTTATHGTGCILSAALTAALTSGKKIPEAIFIAKTFLNQCLKEPIQAGAGINPVWIKSFKNNPADRPQIKNQSR
jgi:hydroxymethylpyrimidine kinase/phosphomethylpyrimidine kinase